MLTLDVLDEIELTTRPLGQIAVGHLIRANYHFPPTRTDVSIEGLDRLPDEGPVYLSMNHTDRYNYFPFQIRLWRELDEFTATWVKGKYYNHPLIAQFMVRTNNIPTPSKGYIITADAVNVLGEPPAPELYRLIRDAWESGDDMEALHRAASDAGHAVDLERLMTTERDLLGRRYTPGNETYLAAIDALFFDMMGAFVRLNEQAFDLGLRILVFPEGTRSRRLSVGRPGLAQMAIRTGATIVPVGCNGADRAYPGDSPLSRGARIVYRIGEPLTPDEELAEFQLEEEFRPFTREADPYAEEFETMTGLVMDRINDLLDPEYRRADDAETVVAGSRRFV